MRIERVENGYMAYVGNLSCHFSTFHEAVLWAEKQVYACDTKSEETQTYSEMQGGGEN